MCKESAKELRSKLKEIGYNRNMVGVTSDYDSINVTVKSIDVDFKKVEELANSYESISRDYATGEILCGGNTYVTVKYSDTLKDELKNKYMNKAEEIFQEIQNSNELENIFIKDGIHAFLGDFQMIWFRIPQEDGMTKRYKCYNCVEGIAEVFAELFLNEKIDILVTSETVTEVEKVEESQQENNIEVVAENATTQTIDNATEFTVIQDVHTKTGATIFVAKLNNKIEYAEFKNIESKIKSIRGYYSRFKKGFIFVEEPTELLKETFGDSKEIKEITTDSTTQEIKEVKPIEININNINADNFPISKEISKRENDGHWVFRTKERDHQQEIINYLQSYQDSILEELNKLEDNSTKNKYKYWLNSFKKRYYDNYYKRLRNDANNPSWITTGRDGRNARKDAKMNSRYDNLMRECVSLQNEYEDKLIEIKGKKIKENDNKFFNAVKSNKKEYKYKRIKKAVNVSNANNYFEGNNLVEKNCYTTTLNNENYYILSIWGSFIVVNSKGERFKNGSCGTLKDAKTILNYYLSEIERAEQVAV